MDTAALTRTGLDLTGFRAGRPQRSGPLTVLPLFGPDRGAEFIGPLSGLKLSRVEGYGNVELKHPGESGLAIVPLHMGYIQDRAQNHCLCRSAFLAPGQTLMFKDACCVQEAQGGFLEEREQWFFILPLELRPKALELRGTENYAKLWDDIAGLAKRYGFSRRGHLEQIISRRRAYLSQFQTRLELESGQTGALFFLNERMAGVEIAPSAAYFRELWMPLVCFCYGVPAMALETAQPEEPRPPLQGGSLTELQHALRREREEFDAQVLTWIGQTPHEAVERKEEERYLDFRLSTLTSRSFAGQYVEYKSGGESTLVYASVVARPEYSGMGATAEAESRTSGSP